ncbi:MAG: hypothetical protein O3C43_17805 [Verrucomicrobia bacterium]|nr:hypothetical protein [Verrucomicrobiota bacterium]MDA1068347.1 hypothetical protein [Verrucomicrobiota bacterium]
MLFIFRKLRRSFFLPGKVRTYVAYAIGEILLIVVGILIAVQIGDWNQDRRDRNEEREILGRIYDELGINITTMSNGLQGDPMWIERIDRVIAAFDGEPIEDNIAFLEDVAGAGAHTIRKQINSSYVEFLGSGRLGLIQKVELRKSIIDYYDDLDQQEQRVEKRTGKYPSLIYKLIPLMDRTNTDTGVREDLSDEQYAMLVQTVLNADLRSHLLHERNRSVFISSMFKKKVKAASEIQTMIQTELNQ